MWECSNVCLHHGVLLFLVSQGFLLVVPFIAFDHYDEENNCNRTREKKKMSEGDLMESALLQHQTAQYNVCCFM